MSNYTAQTIKENENRSVNALERLVAKHFEVKPRFYGVSKSQLPKYEQTSASFLGEVVPTNP